MIQANAIRKNNREKNRSITGFILALFLTSKSGKLLEVLTKSTNFVF